MGGRRGGGEVGRWRKFINGRKEGWEGGGGGGKSLLMGGRRGGR